MSTFFKGKAWKFGDNIDTDIIAPSLYLRSPMDVLIQHAFEVLKPGFYKQVKPGDIIVAGKNFGYGSHRERAAWIPKILGISVIVADSFARTFFRNCINIGMPILACPGVSKIVDEGDEVEVDIERGIVKNLTKGTQIGTKPLPEFILNILKDGGILAHLRKLKQ
jgi:3-isopropylmalate/(R)-2-methylmalate dehydratase small subunit